MDKSKLPLHKREELKRKEDEKLAKEVYEEFVATFSNDAPGKISKTFIRGEVVNPGDNSRTKPTSSRLYKPSPSMHLPCTPAPVDEARRKAQEKAEKIMEEARKSRPGVKLGQKKESKRMSNLESFKEELKKAQEARAERRVLRQQLKDHLGSEKETLLDRIAPSLDNPYLGSYENDPNTTNIFISNLSPRLTEDELCKMFGYYGPLASVKVMWPRSDEEKSRGYNTGFIAFMTRKDAERAFSRLKGKMVMGYEMKIGWGKTVLIPTNPVYIPARMLELALPPPPSGLPFNAQPRKDDREAYHWPLPPQGAPPPFDAEQREAWDKMIRNATIKVVIPTERFLFDNHSPAHVYYRWKLFSILQGDSPTKWSTQPFRMFEGGSLWVPPPMNFYQQGLPKELYDEDEEEEEWVEKGKENEDDRQRHYHYGRGSSSSRYKSRHDRDRSPSPGRRDGTYDEDDDDEGGDSAPPQIPSNAQSSVKKYQLSERQKSTLKEMLDNLSMERDKIAETMIYCVDHAEAAEEILEMICERMFDGNTTIAKKVAKLYLISDILNNCTAKVANVSYFRKHIGSRLEEVFKHVNGVYEKIDARLKAEQFKQRVMSCFRSWEDTAIYTDDFLINLQNVFLGLTSSVEDRKKGTKEGDKDSETSARPDKKIIAQRHLLESHQSAKKAPALKRLVDYDLDGVPMDDDDEEASNEDSRQSDDKSSEKDVSKKEATAENPMFIRSKWEEVDPEQDPKRSRWETVEDKNGEKIFSEDEEDIDGVPLDECPSDDRRNIESPIFAEDLSASVSDSSRKGRGKSPELDRMSDEKRKQLREIEVKVMKLQDELEAGLRKREPGLTIQEEIGKYREKLLHKANKELEKSRRSDADTGSRHSKSKKSSTKGDEEKSDKSRKDKGSSDDREKGKRRDSKESDRKEDRSKDRRKNDGSTVSGSHSSSGSSKDKSKSTKKDDHKKISNRKRSRSASPSSRSKTPSDLSKHKKKKH